MNRLLQSVITLLLVHLCIGLQGEAQESVKLAQTGMQFLSVVSDAHAAAMANAVTSLPLHSASLFFNPACMSESGFLEVAVSRNEWIADIKHTTFSMSIRPAQGDYGVIGVSVQAVNYGDIFGTVVANNDQGYEDIGKLNASGTAIGLGYAKALSEQFSVGGHIRWVRQNLGNSIVPITDSTTENVDNKLTPWVFDFGTLFKTGFKSLTFGMAVRNFSTEVKYVSESFELPLTITFGLSMDVMDFAGDRTLVRSVLLSVDAVHNRDYREQIFAGVECNLLDFFALRGGYISNSDEDGPTFGFGLWRYGLNVDYAYTPFGVFDKVQRFTVRFSM
jgi:hypothetical protein